MQAAKKWRRIMRRFLKPAPPDDPDSLLQQAETEISAAQARHRQRAVAAVTSKNNLQQQINDLQARVDNFRNKANLAAERGDDYHAEQLRSNGEQHEKLLAAMQEKMAQAEAINQLVKETFHLQNEILHQRLAEILALKVQYQASVLQKSMVDALLGEADDTPAKRRAREKRRRILLPDAQKREKEFAALVQAAESTVSSLRNDLDRAHAENNEAAERVLLHDLENEEATLILLRDAQYRARDVRERAERWVGAEPSQASVVNGDANANAAPNEKKNP